MAKRPWRRVVEASEAREGRVGVFTANGIYTRWRELTLDCGHVVERTVRYLPGASEGRRGWARLHKMPPASKMLPAPSRVRCDFCPAVVSSDEVVQGQW